MVERDSLWHWLSLAQHHRLPTRLMDWTYAPYAALHFATSDVASFEQEPAISAVNLTKAHEFLPDFLKSNLDQGEVFTVEMLSRLETRGSAEGAEPFSISVSPGKTIATLGDFDALSGEAGQDFLLFFEPPSIDDRIVNQFALFSVMSDPTVPIDEWLEGHPDLFHRIIIPANPKLTDCDPREGCTFESRRSPSLIPLTPTWLLILGSVSDVTLADRLPAPAL